MIVQHLHHFCQLMKHNCTLCQGASVLTQQVLLNRITSHQKAKIIHMLKFIQVAQQKPACILLHLMIMNFKFVQPKEHVTREIQQCQLYLCRLTQLLMNRLKDQLPFHRLLDSSSVATELPDNSEQPFLLDMSNWQRDSTKFGIVFTGPNGETLLPPNSFARLDSYVNELMQSEYLYLTKNCFTLIQKT